MSIKLINVSNPAAFGVEWVAGETGNRYQLCTSRGTATLTFGVRHADSDRWMTQTVMAPERFGMTSAPKTFAAFLAIAEAYVNA